MSANEKKEDMDVGDIEDIFGKIPCVRGENEQAQMYIAKQKIKNHAIHKFHFEESEMSQEQAET